MNQYETVFILNPVLSEDQVKEAVDKYVSFLKERGASIINKENWGLKKMAYPIQKKSATLTAISLKLRIYHLGLISRLY